MFLGFLSGMSLSASNRKSQITAFSLKIRGFESQRFAAVPLPVGQKRQIDVAGQKLPRDNFCLSLVSQLPSPRG